MINKKRVIEDKGQERERQTTRPPAVRIYDRPEPTGASPTVVLALIALIVLMAIAFLAFRLVF